ncbi:MAG TPA: glucosamine-6-phosphate deaminase [Terriglobales bacterium]|nr:glucosamine-6-phosphate deaminase [Terriglobales bacterium]
MLLKIFDDKVALGRAAAEQAATAIRRAIAERGQARIVAATAASQREFLDALTQMQRTDWTKLDSTKLDGTKIDRAKIDWTKVEAFHLDEYIGLPLTHPGSFRKMFIEQLIAKTGIARYHLIPGDADDLPAAIREVGNQLTSAPIDVAFLGIGENGHIAFNDPPADFTTEDPYLIVDLDEASRRQQVGEAWFSDISQVPKRAISMSPRQILKAGELIVIVPDQRKAQAVKACLEAEISPMVPASILRTHPNATLYLDRASASLLSPHQ